MLERQRPSHAQLHRKAASRAREQLEADAAEKEVRFSHACCSVLAAVHVLELILLVFGQARLAELRSTMTKEKQEIAKFMYAPSHFC